MDESADRKHLFALFAARHDGTLTSEQHAELETLLQHSADARRLWFLSCDVEVGLAEWAEGEHARRSLPPAPALRGVQAPRSRPFRSIVLWVLLAVGLVLAGLLAFHLLRSSEFPELDVRPGVATLTRAVGVTWVDDDENTVKGASLDSQTLALDSGIVQIDFHGGTSLLVEGPARLQILSERGVYLHSGKIRVSTSSRGLPFVVSSPELKVSSQNAVFGLVALEAAAPEIHVLAGIVEASAVNITRPRLLQKHEAVRLDLAGWTDIPLHASLFPDEIAVAALETELNQRRIGDWHRASQSLADDPATIAHYFFDPPSAAPGARLANSAPRTGEAADGEILGPVWTEGRWPWKRALRFTAPADRVGVNLPDALSEVTFGAWIKIDSLPGDLQLLCGSTVPEVGALRWEITRDGRLRLAVAVRRRGDLLLWEADNSPPLLANTRDRWVFVVSTLAQKRLKHYVNGRLVRTNPIYYPEQFRLGAGHLGNLPSVPGRAFAGTLDELFVLSRALNDDEVRDLHRLGRP